jgi:hypothetical protein
MGWIWNVLLCCSNEEFWTDDADEPSETCEPLERINQWIPDGKLVDLTKPTYAKGAGSGMDAWLFGGGFKHFDIDAFVRVVEEQPWKDRPNLQLWVKGDGSTSNEPFTPVRLRAPARRARKVAVSSSRSNGRRKPQRTAQRATRSPKRR